MRPLFPRLGSKYKLRDYIISNLPDLADFDTYVEPFAGSASIFFNLDLDNKKVVLNDKDTALMEAFRSVRTVDVDKLPILTRKEEMKKLIDKPNKTKEEALMAFMYNASNTFATWGFGELFKENSLESKVRKIPEYALKLQGVKLLNKDAIEVIKQYDGKNTLFFIDPPYEKSDKQYKDDEFDLEKLADTLMRIQGRFLLTVNSSASTRRIFARFKQKGFVVKATNGFKRYKTLGNRDRKELLVWR